MHAFVHFEPCSKNASLPSAESMERAVNSAEGTPEPTTMLGRWYGKAKTAALYGTSVDIHEVVEEDAYIAALHARAEKFDEHAEHTFGYLQVRGFINMDS